PLPKARPIARSVAPTTAAPAATAAKDGVKDGVKDSVKQTAAVPPPAAAPALPPRPRGAGPARKPLMPAAVAATSSTSKEDLDALENVIELIRKHSPDDATQVEARISDPVAKKLAEWIILRSDNNNATVERYRAFLVANPSWPSQIFLRKRLEA